MKRFAWLRWAVLGGLLCFLLAGWLYAADGAGGGNVVAEGHIAVKLWEPLTSERYGTWEKIALVANVVVALAGLAYALLLVGQVKNAPQGTPKMQAIAQAVREGANAYLARQFRVVGVLIVVLTVLLYFGALASNAPQEIAWGRAIAFLVGSVFSATVGFVGMRLATIGNLRVAAAAQHSFGTAPGSAGRFDHLFDLWRARLRGLAGLRLWRHAAGPVHARRRRHLHQGGRRGRRPGGQARKGHSRR
jgi:hypothetical protein